MRNEWAMRNYIAMKRSAGVTPGYETIYLSDALRDKHLNECHCKDLGVEDAAKEHIEWEERNGL